MDASQREAACYSLLLVVAHLTGAVEHYLTPRLLSSELKTLQESPFSMSCQAEGGGESSSPSSWPKIEVCESSHTCTFKPEKGIMP